MPIKKNILAPSGAPVEIHEFHRLMVHENGAAHVYVKSHTSAQNAIEGKPVAWMWEMTYDGDLPPRVTSESMEVMLCSHPSSPFFEGEVIAAFEKIDDVIVPPRPSENHTFNWVSKQWEDRRTLADRKKQKRAEIVKDRDALEFGGFEWGGYRFDSDQISQQRIQGSAQLAMAAKAAGQPFSIEWTLADNSVVTLDGDQMLAVGLAMGQHIQAAHSKSRMIKQQIDQAQSKEELESITW